MIARFTSHIHLVLLMDATPSLKTFKKLQITIFDLHGCNWYQYPLVSIIVLILSWFYDWVWYAWCFMFGFEYCFDT